jgi:hypothetical protein
MKKQLLFVALLAGAIFTTNAQAVSFETSEGFNVGPISGQNGWSLAGSMVSANALVSSSTASVGTNSLRINAGTAPSTTLIGVYSPQYTLTDDRITVSFDLKVDALDLVNGSDAYIDAMHLENGSLYVTSRLMFNYQGNIRVVTGIVANQLAYETIGTYTANTWMSVRIEHDFDLGTIDYYLNNNLIYSGVVYNGEQADIIAFRYDSYATGYNVDNLNVYATPAASVGENNLSLVNVYPNPTQGEVVVSGVADAIKNIAVVDLNGRIIKEVSNTEKVNISDLSAGVYMLNISSDSGSVTKKIVKK